MRTKSLLKKGFAVGLIVMFLGMSITPMAGSLQGEKYISIYSSIKELDSVTKTTNTGSQGFNVTLTGTMGENGWYVSNVIITFNADNGSGVIHIYYRLHDNDSWIEDTTGLPITVRGDGYFSFSALIIDESENQWNIGPIPFKIDKTAPIITQFIVKRVGFFSWHFIVNVSDATSGINRVEFFIDCTLIKIDTEYPYDAFWKGFMFIIILKFRRTGDWEYLPNIQPYDNAGNSPEQPNTEFISS